MKTLEQRFWSKVEKTDGCWLWTASVTKKGYGKIGIADGRWELASRVSWELNNGPIPEGMVVCHKCDNPPCVRPEHLFLGSKADNLIDCYQKNRHTRNALGSGEKHPSAKLNRLEVDSIKQSPRTYRQIAKEYNISASEVSNIKNNKRWR